MKKLFLLMTMAVIAVTSFAQEKADKPGKSPEDRAKRRTEAIQRVTGINDEQKGKIYNLIVEKQKAAKDILAKNNNDKNASKEELKQVWSDYRTKFKSTMSEEQYQKWVNHLKEKKEKHKDKKDGSGKTHDHDDLNENEL